MDAAAPPEHRAPGIPINQIDDISMIYLLFPAAQSTLARVSQS